jgi:hypothetical protein
MPVETLGKQLLELASAMKGAKHWDWVANPVAQMTVGVGVAQSPSLERLAHRHGRRDSVMERRSRR